MPYVGKKPADIIATAVDTTTGTFSSNATVGGTLGVTGETTLATHLNMGDNDIIKLGASADLQIYHDASNSIIKDTGTGNLQLYAALRHQFFNADGSSTYAQFVGDGGSGTEYVQLRYANSTKLATTSSGIQVTGNIANASGDFTLDVAGNILLDADDGNIHFKDGGTGFVSIINSSGDAIIQGGVQDKDIIFKGNDGGGVITALTLDMSAAGAAAFNSYLTSTAVYGKDDGNTGIQFDGSDVITLHTGGAEHMKIDANGHVTMPNQPAFLVSHSANQTNFSAGGSAHTVAFDTEIFDQGSNFASNTFTAPIAGRYQLQFSMNIRQVDTAATVYSLVLQTSNRQYELLFDPNFSADGLMPICLSALADMDASDTAFVKFFQSGGAQQSDLNNAPELYFSGFLAC